MRRLSSTRDQGALSYEAAVLDESRRVIEVGVKYADVRGRPQGQSLFNPDLRKRCPCRDGDDVLAAAKTIFRAVGGRLLWRA